MLDPDQVTSWLKVYMPDSFLFARLNLPNVLISIANFFSIAIFLPRVPKASTFTSGGVQNHETKNRRLGTIVTSFQDSELREYFSDIFLFSNKQRTIVPFLSDLISSQ